MRFMILIHSSDVSEAVIRTEAHEEFRTAHDQVIRELSASGELVETQELPAHGAKIVSTRNELSVIDGPSTAAGEWISGYYLVEVAEENRALALAARFVEARYATVEVRRLGGS